MKNNSNWYGVYVGDKPVHNRNDLVYASRKRGAITTDAELIEFCEKVTCGSTACGDRSASSESATGGDDTERPSRREAGDGRKSVGRIKRT